MANQLLALQVERPRFDYPGAVSRAQGLVRNDQMLERGRQEIEGGRLSNDLAGLKLRDYADESNALREYRGAVRSGDPKAIDRLAGYPDIQKQMLDALDGMAPEQLIGAKMRARAFGEAASYIRGFEPGSPAQRQAWNQKIDELADAGYIDGGMADHWKQAGPSELLLDQADMAAELVSGYLRKPKEAKVPENVKILESHMADWDRNYADLYFTEDFPRKEEDIAKYKAARLVEERRARRAFGMDSGPQVPTVGGRHYNLGEEPEDESAAPLEAPATEGVAKDNAKQQPLTRRPRAVNKQTGEIVEFDATTNSWVPVEQ